MSISVEPRVILQLMAHLSTSMLDLTADLVMLMMYV